MNALDETPSPVIGWLLSPMPECECCGRSGPYEVAQQRGRLLCRDCRDDDNHWWAWTVAARMREKYLHSGGLVARQACKLPG